MTAELSAAQRGRLAHQLVPLAMELACLVRYDGDPDAIAEFLSGLHAAERDALFVVLAAMVDTERTPQELLAWVDFDEHGRPLPPGAAMVLHDGKHRTAATQRPQAECGTPWGYERHRRCWEPICDPCRDAHATYRRGLREKRKQRDEAILATAGTTARGAA